MTRLILILFMLLALASPALAQWEPPLVMDDPEARRIAAGEAHETGLFGPYCAMVSVFAAREPGDRGCRLYVGLVDDIYDRDSRVRMWRGPVADGWWRLAHVPEYVSDVTEPNPARYRITREVLAPGGRYHSLMEIDLESSPPRVHLVEGTPSVPGSPDSSPLEEMAPLSESMRMLPRLFKRRSFLHNALRLTSYALWHGDSNLPPKRPPEIKAWQTTMSSHLLLVSPYDRPEKAMAYFLPMRPDGWMLKGLLPASPRYHGRFVLEMFAGYLYPGWYGRLVNYYSREIVTVGMDGMSITTQDAGYVYDEATERFEKEKPAARPKKTR